MSRIKVLQKIAGWPHPRFSVRPTKLNCLIGLGASPVAAVGPGIPATPADIGKGLQVCGEGAPGLPLIGRYAAFGLRDFPFEFCDRLLHFAGLPGVGHLADRESRDFQRLQGFAVLFELCPVPGNFAIAVSNHVEHP